MLSYLVSCFLLIKASIINGIRHLFEYIEGQTCNELLIIVKTDVIILWNGSFEERWTLIYNPLPWKYTYQLVRDQRYRDGIEKID